MRSCWVELTAEDGSPYDAYLCLPPTGTGPGLVLFQEIFGVNTHIRAVAQQYADDGFVVLAPDVFWRQQKRVELGYEGAERQTALGFVNGMDHGTIAGDIFSYVRALRARPEVTGKVGAFGFCLGGRLSYIAAAMAEVDFAGCYYGGGIHTQLDLAARITCPIQFHYGLQDSHISKEMTDQIELAFANHPHAEFHYYPAAGHGFNCWARSAYHQPSAVLAHAHTLRAMARHLL